MKIQKIYFDLDGVLADFDRGIIELCKIDRRKQGETTPQADDDMWLAVKNVGNFYNKLEPMQGSVEMFRKLYEQYGDRCEILSGIPKPRRQITTAGEDKINWVRRVLSENIKVNIVYREEKKEYVKGPDCILIDDLQRNIDEWKECGGTGILFTSPEQVLEEIAGYVKG